MGYRHTIPDRRRTDPFPFLKHGETLFLLSVLVLGG